MMRQLQEQLKTKHYSPVYLLYGSESYLKHLYQKKLQKAILENSHALNQTSFYGKETSIEEVEESARTLPFFAQRRLVLLEETGWCKTKALPIEFLETMPETTHMVFIETEVDKRGRLFQWIKKHGTAVELNGLSEREQKIWVASLLKKSGKKIQESTIDFLLQKVGTDMETVSKELEKLVAYTGETEVITEQEIDQICITQVESKIFLMIDAIAEKKINRAILLYRDLLLCKERPLSILFLLTRQFSILLEIKQVQSDAFHKTSSELAKSLGIPAFAVKKYQMQARRFTEQILYERLQRCLWTEEQIKTGKLEETIGVELLIVESLQM